MFSEAARLGSSDHVAVLSTADWDRPLWTNKQYVASALAQDVSVTFVNSVGLRTASLHKRDLRRIASRLRAVVRGGGQRPLAVANGDTLRVVTPRALPGAWPAGSVISTLNRSSLRRQLKPRLADAGVRVLWTFTPVTYGLERYFDYTVYHSVDLLQFFPGVNARPYLEAERSLLSEVDVAIGSSSQIVEHLHDQGGREVILWENVGDLRAYLSVEPARDEKCRVVFAGNLAPHKVDSSLLQTILDARDDLELHLAGPLAEGGGDCAEFGGVMRNPRCVYHGVLNHYELARLYSRCWAGVIPYRLNNYTRGVFPLKVYEYMASGMPVLSTLLPCLPSLPGLTLLETARDFIDSVCALSGPPSAHESRMFREIAGTHGWEGRSSDVRELAAALIAKGKPYGSEEM